MAAEKGFSANSQELGFYRKASRMKTHLKEN